MLFIILGAFWTIHESVSVVMLSLPSSRASDEEIAARKKEVLEPKELLLALIFLIIADNALLLVSLVAMTASDIPNEQAIWSPVNKIDNLNRDFFVLCHD